MFNGYEANASETHLYIIWNKGLPYKEKIIASLKKAFNVISILNLQWDEDCFENNIRRFYGKNLPLHSEKVNECGKGPFTLIIIEDENPIYAPRYTNQGIQTVNVNMFDHKELFRKIMGINAIHATNSEAEFSHDITLLLGVDWKSIALNTVTGTVDCGKVCMPGADGWNSISELLKVLNKTSQYIILRNYENFPDKIEVGKHSDIDILCDNYKSMKLILNGKESTNDRKRVQNTVRIGNDFVNIDIRHVGDNYLCKKWEEELLSSRVFDDKGFYHAAPEQYLFSLIYHALIQKSKVSQDYISRISEMSEVLIGEKINLGNESEALDFLQDFMNKNGYKFVEPKDKTVAYNYFKIGYPASVGRRIHHLKSDIRKQVNLERRDLSYAKD